MVSRSLLDRNFIRYDQFDYQKFGLARFWYTRDTLLMLTSFYMEVNGLFEKGDPVVTFNKIYLNYMKFIVYDVLLGNKVKFTSVVNEHEVVNVEPGHLDLDRTCFNKEDILNYIKDNNSIKLDVDKLYKYLSCEEVPNIPCSVNEALPSSDENSNSIEIISSAPDLLDIIVKNNLEDSKYIFKHMNDIWVVVYEGKPTMVKDSLGMKYIEQLIKYKHEQLEWTALHNAVKGTNQELIDPDTASEDVSDGYDLSQGMSKRIYAGKSKKWLKSQIENLTEDLKEANENRNHEKADKLKDDIEAVKKYVLDTYRSDGTLKENAKDTDKMINGIKAAIKRAVRDIEIGLPDLGNHLNNFIVLKWQRSKPGYFPPVDLNWVL